MFARRLASTSVATVTLVGGLFSTSAVRLQSAKALAGQDTGSQSLSARRRQAAAAAAAVAATHDVANEEGYGAGDAMMDTAHRNATSVLAGPYRRVGNIFIVTCEDHPFKHGWEVNRMLRDLRLEFKGQTTIHPDVPDIRKRLWRVRHLVRLDILDLDEAKELVGVPAHLTFTDLAGQIPASFGRGGAFPNPGIRSKVRFMRLRRMRLRDVLHRDALEKRLLEEKRKALASSATAAAAKTQA